MLAKGTMQGAVLRLGDAASHTHEEKSLTPRYRHNKPVIVSTSSVINESEAQNFVQNKGNSSEFQQNPISRVLGNLNMYPQCNTAFPLAAITDLQLQPAMYCDVLRSCWG